MKYMEGYQKRKRYTIMLTSLLCVSILFSTNFIVKAFVSDTIIVDDDGTGDYKSITEAIQKAYHSDTILVRSGIYEEQNIIIDKTLTISGEQANSTIIQGNKTNTLLFIKATNVTISGFTFSGGGGSFLGSNIDISADDCIISNNIIIDHEDIGITIHDSSKIVIKDNIISDCLFAGIRLYNNTKKNIIQNNQISNCIGGIYIHDSTDQLIQENKVSNCSKGIYLEECTENLIFHNHLCTNNQGVFVSYADANLITDNNFISNDEHTTFTTWLSPKGLQLSRWNANYYDDSKGVFPRWIPGLLFIRTFNPIGLFLPWGCIDWNPAKEPYDLKIC